MPHFQNLKRNKMMPEPRVVMMLLALTALGGCETTDSLFGRTNGEGVTVRSQAAKDPVLPDAAPPAPAERRMGDQRPANFDIPRGGGLTPPPGFESMQGKSYSEMVNNDSVEIFSLDAPADTGARLPQPESPGMAAATDSSVEVFPLGGGNTAQGQGPARIADIPPPSRNRPGYPSPFVPGPNAQRAGHPPSSRLPALPPGVKGGFSQTQERIFFKHNSSGLSAEDRRKLTNVAEQYKASDKKVTVEGHASKTAETKNETARETVNLKKSLDRAYQVSAELIRQGLPAENIKACGYGDNQPPRATNGKSEEAASRRVEISSGF